MDGQEILPDTQPGPPPFGSLGGMGSLGAQGDTRSIGAAMWEILHPAQVQADARAVGAPVPSVMDIITGAAGDVATAADESIAQARDTAAQALDAGAVAGKWIVVGVVALVALELLKKAK